METPWGPIPGLMWVLVAQIVLLGVVFLLARQIRLNNQRHAASPLAKEKASR